MRGESQEMSHAMWIELQGENPPIWAVGQMRSSCWYYENRHGEQWVAVRKGDTLWISGLDIGWEEISLTVKQAEAEADRIRDLISAQAFLRIPGIREILGKTCTEASEVRRLDSQEYPLEAIILDSGELLWVFSVLQAAIPAMKYALSKKHHPGP